MTAEQNSPSATNDFGHCWLLLADCIRIAVSPQSIMFAVIGTLLTSAAWKLSGKLSAVDSQAESVVTFHTRASRWPGQSELGGLADYLPPSWSGQLPPTRPWDPLFSIQARLVEPFRRLTSPDLAWPAVAYYLTGGLSSAAIWALFGNAISRAAVVQLGLRRRTGPLVALRFAARKWLDLFSAPTLPLLGVTAMAIPFVMMGWLSRFDFGLAVVGVLWGIFILSGLLMTILAVGLFFSWPLMWGAVATEDSDAFDAISRAFAYTFQRPLHYLYYASCAAALGLLTWLLAWCFVESIVSLSFWGLSWGSGTERFLEICRAVDGDDVELSSSAWLGSRLISFWVGLVRSAASAFSFSYFWSASAAIYLLLRKATDKTELADICCPDHDEPQSTEA